MVEDWFELCRMYASKRSPCETFLFTNPHLPMETISFLFYTIHSVLYLFHFCIVCRLYYILFCIAKGTKKCVARLSEFAIDGHGPVKTNRQVRIFARAAGWYL